MNQPQTISTPGLLPFLLVATLFVTSRLLVFNHPPPFSDVGLYWQYAHRFETAWHTGKSFYAVHRSVVAADARADASTAAEPENLKVEYPPLALAVMIWPIFFVDDRPDDPEQYSPDSYDRLFRGFMAIADLVLVALIWLLIRRLYPAEAAWASAARLAVYVVLGAASWPVWYDRLDLFMTVLVMASLLLLVNGVHYFWSFLLLALAINYKLIPVVAAPVWLIGSVPVAYLVAARQRRQYLGLLQAPAGRAAVLAALVVAIFLPFYWYLGPDTLGFIEFHRARPMEIGSVFSSLLLALRTFGYPLDFSIEFGGLNVHSELATTFIKVSSALLVLVVGAITILLSAAVYRSRTGDDLATSRATSLAQLHPRLCVAFALAFFAAAMTVSKVFTSQYLIVLFPLVALLPFTFWQNLALAALCLACCVLTTLIFPFLWLSDIRSASTGREWSFYGPSWLGAIVLELRSLTLAAFTVVLLVLCWRRFVLAGVGGQNKIS